MAKGIEIASVTAKRQKRVTERQGIMQRKDRNHKQLQLGDGRIRFDIEVIDIPY